MSGLKGPKDAAWLEGIAAAYRELVVGHGGDHEAVGAKLLAILIEQREEIETLRAIAEPVMEKARRKKGSGRPKAEGNPLPENETIGGLAKEADEIRQTYQYANGKPFTARFAARLATWRAIPSGAMAGESEEAARKVMLARAEDVRKRMSKSARKS